LRQSTLKHIPGAALIAAARGGAKAIRGRRGFSYRLFETRAVYFRRWVPSLSRTLQQEFCNGLASFDYRRTRREFENLRRIERIPEFDDLALRQRRLLLVRR
jgi:hypothetical protein